MVHKAHSLILIPHTNRFIKAP
jgi:hypothetical protein